MSFVIRVACQRLEIWSNVFRNDTPKTVKVINSSNFQESAGTNFGNQDGRGWSPMTLSIMNLVDAGGTKAKHVAKVRVTNENKTERRWNLKRPKKLFISVQDDRSRNLFAWWNWADICSLSLILFSSNLRRLETCLSVICTELPRYKVKTWWKTSRRWRLHDSLRNHDHPVDHSNNLTN